MQSSSEWSKMYNKPFWGTTSFTMHSTTFCLYITIEIKHKIEYRDRRMTKQMVSEETVQYITCRSSFMPTIEQNCICFPNINRATFCSFWLFHYLSEYCHWKFQIYVVQCDKSTEKFVSYNWLFRSRHRNCYIISISINNHSGLSNAFNITLCNINTLLLWKTDKNYFSEKTSHRNVRSVNLENLINKAPCRS